MIMFPVLLYGAGVYFYYEVLSDWKLKRVLNDIELSYRDVGAAIPLSVGP